MKKEGDNVQYFVILYINVQDIFMRKNDKIQKLNRFAELAKLGEVVFHTDDLANLWHITNKNTLYTTIKRYLKRGLLFRIYKGFYAIKPPHDIDPDLLGIKALHGYGYVSCETILRDELRRIE